METLIIYYQLVGEPDDTCHVIHYGYNKDFSTLTDEKIDNLIIRHANGKEIRRAWW